MLKLLQIAALLTLLSLVETQKEPHFKGQRTTIVHLFEWSWPAIAEECENFLGPQGYAGVQISPPNEVREIEGNPWWARYQPVSYILQSKSGNQLQLQEMIKPCLKSDVLIYADIVINHMTAYAEGDSIGTGGLRCNYKKGIYPAVPYDADDFHAACNITRLARCQK